MKSGSLITARDGADQGRDVMAVPGHPFDARAAGCNMLIRDGALLVRSPQDILEALGQFAPPSPKAPQSEAPAICRPLADISSLHSQILARLGPSPLAEDQLARDLNQPTSALASALITLELDGHILRQPGSLLSRLT